MPTFPTYPSAAECHTDSSQLAQGSARPNFPRATFLTNTRSASTYTGQTWTFECKPPPRLADGPTEPRSGHAAHSSSHCPTSRPTYNSIRAFPIDGLFVKWATVIWRQSVERLDTIRLAIDEHWWIPSQCNTAKNLWIACASEFLDFLSVASASPISKWLESTCPDYQHLNWLSEHRPCCHTTARLLSRSARTAPTVCRASRASPFRLEYSRQYYRAHWQRHRTHCGIAYAARDSLNGPATQLERLRGRTSSWFHRISVAHSVRLWCSPAGQQSIHSARRALCKSAEWKIARCCVWSSGCFSMQQPHDPT